MGMVIADLTKTAQRRDQGVTKLTRCQCIHNILMSVRLVIVPRIIEDKRALSSYHLVNYSRCSFCCRLLL